MPNRRRSRMSRGARRPTTWEQIPNTTSLGPAAGKLLIDFSNDNIIDDESSGGTILRMIGSVRIEHDLRAQALEEQEVAIGITVVTKDAIAAFAVPDPLSTLDQNHDWYYWSSRNGTLGPAGSDDGSWVWNFDIRTSRRLRGGYRLVYIVEKDLTELGIEINTSVRNLWFLQG